jgi:NAD(P)H-dependent FMN reductase
MTTRLLAIHGSARSRGNSRRLLDEVLDTVRKHRPDVHIEVVRAYEALVDPCIACGACEEDEIGCQRLGDRWHDIESALRAADILVIATPVYFMGPPAPLKAMIDRLQAMWWYRERGGQVATNEGPFRRCGLILTAAGSDMVFVPTHRIAKAAFNTLDFDLVGEVPARELEDLDEAGTRIELLDAARALGRTLVE